MRPDPILRIDSAPFWEACERGELVVQECGSCESQWHPPRPMCPRCHSLDKHFTPVSGRAKVLSWVKQIRSASFGFAESPYVILVELEEGPRLVSNLDEAEPPTIGMDVVVSFAQTSGGKAVPVFKRAKA